MRVRNTGEPRKRLGTGGSRDVHGGHAKSVASGLAPAVVLSRLLTAGLCLLLSAGAHAVSLGDLRSVSSFGRPLDVEFPILLDNHGAAGPDGLPIVTIADYKAYALMGVNRPDFLDRAEISMERSGMDVTVHVRTQERVVLPYVPLLIQVELPSGAYRRLYELLLDPVGENGQPTAPAGTPIPGMAAPVITPYTPLPQAPPALPPVFQLDPQLHEPAPADAAAKPAP